MTGFEIEGAKRQRDSESAVEAIRNFRHSCYLCGVKGKHIDCRDCEISRWHEIMLDNSPSSYMVADIETKQNNEFFYPDDPVLNDPYDEMKRLSLPIRIRKA